MGLLALMLLHESRRAARTSPIGRSSILLDDQDRSLWNRAQIAEGAAARGAGAGVAPVRALHDPGGDLRRARRGADRRGHRLGRDRRPLRRAAARIDPSPVIELNRAVAVAMRDGPAAGLALIDAILDRGDLREYRLAHAARAELCRRLGRNEDARAAYQRALQLTRLEPEKRFLEKRLREVDV